MPKKGNRIHSARNPLIIMIIRGFPYGGGYWGAIIFALASVNSRVSFAFTKEKLR